MSWLLVGWPTQSTASARSAQSSVWPSVDQDEIYVALTKEVCPGICMSEEKLAAKIWNSEWAHDEEPLSNW